MSTNIVKQSRKLIPTQHSSKSKTIKKTLMLVRTNEFPVLLLSMVIRATQFHNDIGKPNNPKSVLHHLKGIF